MNEFQMNEVFAAIQSTIEKLDMSGSKNAAVNLKNLNQLVYTFSAQEPQNFDF